MDVFTVLIAFVSQVHTFIKTYQIAYFNYIQCVICQLYLDKTIKNKIKNFCSIGWGFIFHLFIKKMGRPIIYIYKPSARCYELNKEVSEMFLHT